MIIKIIPETKQLSRIRSFLLFDKNLNLLLIKIALFYVFFINFLHIYHKFVAVLVLKCGTLDFLLLIYKFKFGFSFVNSADRFIFH